MNVIFKGADLCECDFLREHWECKSFVIVNVMRAELCTRTFHELSFEHLTLMRAALWKCRFFLELSIVNFLFFESRAKQCFVNVNFN